MTRVVVESATVEDVDALVEAWVALAAEQRAHGSHLLAEGNRAAVREDLSRRAVLGEALVARRRPSESADASDRIVRTLDADLGAESSGDGVDLPSAFLGFVSYGLAADGFERDVDRGVIHNVYVRPGARSAGVGTALLSAAEAALADAGADRVTLEALADNDRARSFYRAAGYAAHRVELETDPSEER